MRPAPAASLASRLVGVPRAAGTSIRKKAPAWRLAGAIGLLLLLARPLAAQDDVRGDEYRINLYPYVNLSERTNGFGEFGYIKNADLDFLEYYVGAGGNYAFNDFVQAWSGLLASYRDNDFGADRLELRPYVGMKFFLPNSMRWHIYNYTRFEQRFFQNRATEQWRDESRLRSRFGLEIPLARPSRAWEQGTWYGLIDGEPMLNFDDGEVDLVQTRTGFGYVVNQRIRLELLFYGKFNRPIGGGGLELTDQAVRLNIRIALSRDALERVFDGGDSEP